MARKHITEEKMTALQNLVIGKAVLAKIAELEAKPLLASDKYE